MGLRDELHLFYNCLHYSSAISVGDYANIFLSRVLMRHFIIDTIKYHIKMQNIHVCSTLVLILLCSSLILAISENQMLCSDRCLNSADCRRLCQDSALPMRFGRGGRQKQMTAMDRNALMKLIRIYKLRK